MILELLSALSFAFAAPKAAKSSLCFGTKHPECATLESKRLSWETHQGTSDTLLTDSENKKFEQLFNEALKKAEEIKKQQRKPVARKCTYRATLIHSGKYSGICVDEAAQFEPVAKLKAEVQKRVK